MDKVAHIGNLVNHSQIEDLSLTDRQIYKRRWGSYHDFRKGATLGHIYSVMLEFLAENNPSHAVVLNPDINHFTDYVRIRLHSYDGDVKRSPEDNVNMHMENSILAYSVGLGLKFPQIQTLMQDVFGRLDYPVYSEKTFSRAFTIPLNSSFFPKPRDSRGRFVTSKMASA